MNQARCTQCGKDLLGNGNFPFSIVLGGYVCLDCLPPEAQAAWERLEESTRNMRNLSQPQIERFREKALYVPIHDLIMFWRKPGIVHTSLTSLTHENTGKAFQVVWSERFADGVEYHDNFARNFNEGIKYPNIRMSGLADFEHLRAVEKPTELPEQNCESIAMDLRYGQTPLSHREGNATFARSISEVLIVAMHAALTWKLQQKDVQRVTLPTLVSLIRENGGNGRQFEIAWQTEALDNIFNDLKAAVASDVLELRRFVRCGELFLLNLERWT